MKKNTIYFTICCLFFISIHFSLSPSITVANKTAFDAGKYQGTYYSDQGVILEENKLSGKYTSFLYDTGAKSIFSDISWSDFPYKQPLPDNRISESSYHNGNIDMSENKLLLHFDSESGVINLLDSSGNGNNGIAKGVITSSTGIIGQAFSSENTDSYAEFSSLFSDNPTKSFTFLTWLISQGNQYNRGSIKSYESKSLIFETERTYHTKILKITDNIYAIAYKKRVSCGDECSQYRATIVTVSVSSNGEITKIKNAKTFDYESDTINFIHVSGDIYALVFQGSKDDGYILTVNINQDGTIGSQQNVLEFDNSDGREPVITHLKDDLFVIAYTQRYSCGEECSAYRAKLVTLTISTDGKTISKKKSQTIYPTDTTRIYSTYRPSIIRISDSIIAVAMYIKNSGGNVKTFAISSNGLAITEIDSYKFDSATIDYTNIDHITNNIYAITFSKEYSGGYVKTISITDSGDIGSSVLGTFTIDNNDCDRPELIQINNKIYGVIYEGSSSNGFFTTFSIDASGMISSKIDSKEFDTSEANYPTVAFQDEVLTIAYSDLNDNGKILTSFVNREGYILTSSTTTLEFDKNNGEMSSIVRVNDNLLAIAYQGDNDDGWLKTYDISQSGAFTNKDQVEFATAFCKNPHIVHLNKDTFVIAYTGNNNVGYIKTVSIDSTGTLPASSSDIPHLSYNTPGYEPFLLPINKDIIAIIFRGDNNNCYVKTYSITENGDLSYLNSVLTINAPCYTPQMIHINDNSYSAVYRGRNDAGNITSFTIDNDGKVGTNIIDYAEFEDGNDDAYNPHIAKVYGNLYAIAYTQGDNNGKIRPLVFNSDGTIQEIKQDVQFASHGKNPFLLNVRGSIFAVAYQDSSNRCYLKTSSINLDGTVTNMPIASKQISSYCFEPVLTYMNEHLYAISYEGGYSDGFITTINLDTEHKNIFNEKPLTIDVTKNHAYFKLHNRIIPVELKDQWNHLAITFNQDTKEIITYINGEKNSISFASLLYSTSRDSLIIGENFYGKLDEFAFFNKLLSEKDIKNIYSRAILEKTISIRSCNDKACNKESYYILPVDSPQTLTIPTNQYVQFSIEYSTENAKFSPNLSSVSINYAPSNICGDGSCQGDETAENCVSDCCHKDGTAHPGITCSAFCGASNQCVGIDIGNGDQCKSISELCDISCQYFKISGTVDQCACVDGVFTSCSQENFCNNNNCEPCSTLCDGLCLSGECDHVDPDCDSNKGSGATGICCGNGKCDTTENCNICPADCSCNCGDGICSGIEGENTCTCPLDCGSCGGDVTNQTCKVFSCVSTSCEIISKDNCCGNLICEKNEHSNSCIDDCPAICGDSICTPPLEDTNQCPADCCQTISLENECINNVKCKWVSSCVKKEITDITPEPIVISVSPSLTPDLSVSPLNSSSPILSPSLNISIIPDPSPEPTDNSEKTTSLPTIIPIATPQVTSLIIATPIATSNIVATIMTTPETIISTPKASEAVELTPSPQTTPDVEPELLTFDNNQETESSQIQENLPKATIHILKNKCDCASDNNPCTDDFCIDDSCIHKPVLCGTPCGENKVCSLDGQCKLLSQLKEPCQCAPMCAEGLTCSSQGYCEKTLCGDGKCEGMECRICEADCNKEICFGNGFCDLNYEETCQSAPGDCLCPSGFICNPSSPYSTSYGCHLIKCGDTSCDAPFETPVSCCLDCGCPENYYCDKNECKSHCGNGKCDENECKSCQSDCNCNNCKCDAELEIEREISGKSGTEQKVLLTIFNTGELDDSFSLYLIENNENKRTKSHIKIDADSSEQFYIPIPIGEENSKIIVGIQGNKNTNIVTKEISVIPVSDSLIAQFRFFADIKDVAEILFLLLSIIFAILFAKRRKEEEDEDDEEEENKKTQRHHQISQTNNRYWLQQYYQGQQSQQRQYRRF